MEISSVARKKQKISQTAAAVFVITQDDIRRSGAVSLPEVLRLAPGLQVARIDATKWAVSARGFNGRFANKMLVLIDGRSIYTNLYSGTYWDQYDILLEDIERIEVIRGPGATTWGANAVNGVINIITKPASATEGGFVTFSGGPEDTRYFGARYGGKIGKKVTYRMFSRMNQLPGSSMRGVPGDATGDSQRGGGRLEWELNSRDSLTVHADGYRGDSGQTMSQSITGFGPLRPEKERVGTDGGYMMARWRRTGEKSETALQWFLNDEHRAEGFGKLDARTLDVDFQHRHALSKRHELMWGAGLRETTDRIAFARPGFHIDPESRRTAFASTFAQDEISIIPDKLILTAGSKFLAQQYNRFDWQPGARLLWAPNQRHSLWASATRAVRTPSRRDRDISFEFPLPETIAPRGTFARYQGSDLFRNEHVNSVEAGYRHQFGERFSLDLALFRSNYRDLQLSHPGAPEIAFRPVFRVTIPLTAANGDAALSRGGEASVQWKMTSRLRLSGSYSHLSLRYARPVSVLGLSSDRDPRHQARGRLSWDVSRRVTADAFAYQSSRLLAGVIPGYVRADVRVGWRFKDQWELSVGGRNLLDRRHVEFMPEDFTMADEIRRSAYVRLTWRFR